VYVFRVSSGHSSPALVAFVVLGFVSSVPSQQVAVEKCNSKMCSTLGHWVGLQNLNSINQSINQSISRLSLIITMQVDSSRQSQTEEIMSRDQMTSSRTLLHCPSSSSSSSLSKPPCSCSVDLVVRCQGHGVTQVPQLSPEVDLVLAELNMAATGVGKLLPVDFLGVRGVRRVVFTENHLSDDGALSEEAFSTLGGHLTSLVLGACALRTLPPRLLIHLTQLNVLHLCTINPHNKTPRRQQLTTVPQVLCNK